MGIKAPKIPVFRVGDDPPLIIEHEGIIAAFVGRKNRGKVVTWVDMLGKLHQMAMVERDDNHAVERTAGIKQGCCKPDNTLI